MAAAARAAVAVVQQHAVPVREAKAGRVTAARAFAGELAPSAAQTQRASDLGRTHYYALATARDRFVTRARLASLSRSRIAFMARRTAQPLGVECRVSKLAGSRSSTGRRCGVTSGLAFGSRMEFSLQPAVRLCW